MVDTEGDATFPSNHIDINRKIAVENARGPWSTGNAYVEDADNQVEEDEDEEYIDIEDVSEDDDGGDGVQRIAYEDYECGHEDNDDDDDDDNGQRNLKKRKSKTLLNYNFAPRVPAPLSAAASAPKPSYGGRNPLTNWTEQESFTLLDAWGDRFIKRGRKNLRSKQWEEVTEKVNQVSEVGRTNTQCRNRLDTLKKKYKKEKKKVGEPMSSSPNNWVYFEKMDSLLSCQMDSGDYAFMNPKVPLKRVKKVDKMKDSAEKSGVRGREDDSEVLPSKKKNNRRVTAASLNMLADSVNKFSEIYEKIENSRIQQMLELKRMWMDFYKDLELHRNQILDRARAEMATIQQGDG